MSVNILKYESDVWKTADLLRGAGIKESDFPKFMMPFFALLMVESRLIRLREYLEKKYPDIDIEAFIELFQIEGLGYNDFIVRDKKHLKTFFLNDKNFNTDFQAYLKSFDSETRNLLGVNKGSDEAKYLDISGIAGQLSKKHILFDYAKAWSEIDLTPFNNSEITTLEEHIKRKWADISAETAGEQYTPDDIIALIAELIITRVEDDKKFLSVYDPTCGGGNLLFGVEDKIHETYPNKPTATFGQEWNDSLYALAKIESRFRKDTFIEYGNTLTDTGKFYDKNFQVIVANPPYGVDWKGYEKDIRNDKTGRFVALPSISDGQFLFTQHIIHKLSEDGMAVVVHNGSTLFSGDAGGGESNIRKYFFDKDYVEAIVQLPTDEFFNTGIYTYLWIFSKNKPPERKDKVMLINASEIYEPLKKSKGKKRKQMIPENRAKIIKSFLDFQDNEFTKIFDKWHFYYNKQSIMLTNVDENGKYIELSKIAGLFGEGSEDKSIQLEPVKITQLDIDTNEKVEIAEFVIKTYEGGYTSLIDYHEKEIKTTISKLDYKEKDLKVYTKDATYWYDQEKETIIKKGNNNIEELGCGKIVIKSSYKKPTKTKGASIIITVELTQDLEKDYEIIPYHPDEEQNNKQIANFMAKYITKPFKYIDRIVGVEVNFNKVFYTPEKLRSLETITKDLADLEKELSNLENEFRS